jgi:hypothetical protein
MCVSGWGSIRGRNALVPSSTEVVQAFHCPLRGLCGVDLSLDGVARAFIRVGFGVGGIDLALGDVVFGARRMVFGMERMVFGLEREEKRSFSCSFCAICCFWGVRWPTAGEAACDRESRGLGVLTA